MSAIVCINDQRTVGDRSRYLAVLIYQLHENALQVADVRRLAGLINVYTAAVLHCNLLSDSQLDIYIKPIPTIYESESVEQINRLTNYEQ